MTSSRRCYVYILTNAWHTVLYTGMTNDLIRRVMQHRRGNGGKFTRRYNVTKLVYFETCDNPAVAITREKQIKGGSRADKLALIASDNPEWRDLFGELT